MQKRAIDLVEEISQIFQQYKLEVPGEHRPWPQAIKERVFELHSHGVPITRISKLTGIAKQTLYGWSSERKALGFREVKVLTSPTVSSPTAITPVVSKKAKFLKKTSSSEKFRKPPIATIVTAAGFKIEGVEMEALFDMDRLK